MVEFQIQFEGKHLGSKTIVLNVKGNFKGMKEELDWENRLEENSVDELWQIFKQLFHNTAEIYQRVSVRKMNHLSCQDLLSYNLMVQKEVAAEIAEPNLTKFQKGTIALENHKRRERALSGKLNRFPTFDGELKELCTSAVSANTTKATLYSLNVWRYWCVTRELKQYMDITKIPPVKLNELLEDFYVTVRKTDGSDFLATSLHAIRRGLDRVLKNANVGFSIGDAIFKSSTQKLKDKLRMLNKAGMSGSRSRNIIYFTGQDEEEMWQAGYLGDTNPVALLSVVVKFNSQYFNMRTLQEHVDLMYGDIELLKDAENRPFFARTDMVKRESKVCSNKLCFGQVYHEHSEGLKRCPYCLLYKYMYTHRPPSQRDPKSPFYLVARKDFSQLDSVWFEEQRMGLRSLRAVVPKLAKKVRLEQSESFTFVSFTQASLLKPGKFLSTES